jgi:hypothetical protein
MSSDDDVRPDTPVARIYQPTPEESATVRAMTARGKARPPSPKLLVERTEEPLAVNHDHPDPETGRLMLVNALGTVDHDFAEGLIGQLMSAGTQDEQYDGQGPNFMLSVIQGIMPPDEVEAMLAAQMAAVHMATMSFARRLAHAEDIPRQDAAERAFNKLARTFAARMEALKRYRTGGEQKVTVQHVTVNDGGQAIVGSVSPLSGGGGGSGKRKAAP